MTTLTMLEGDNCYLRSKQLLSEGPCNSLWP